MVDRIIANTPKVMEARKKSQRGFNRLKGKKRDIKESVVKDGTAPKERPEQIPGTTMKSVREIRKWAFKTGIMPHEFMLRMMRGETYDGYKCTMSERLALAKDVAPYFIPKLANIAHTGDDNEGPVQTNNLNIDVSVLRNMTDAELDVLEKVLGKLDRPNNGTEGQDKSIEASEEDDGYYAGSIDGDGSEYVAPGLRDGRSVEEETT